MKSIQFFLGTLHFWWDILVVLMDPPTLVALVTLVAPTLVAFSAGSPFFRFKWKLMFFHSFICSYLVFDICETEWYGFVSIRIIFGFFPHPDPSQIGGYVVMDPCCFHYQ